MFIFFSVYSQAEVVMKRNRPIKRLKVHFRRQVLSIFYVAESWGGGGSGHLLVSKSKVTPK